MPTTLPDQGFLNKALSDVQKKTAPRPAAQKPKVEDEIFDGPNGWTYNKTKRFAKSPSGREYNYGGTGLPSEAEFAQLVEIDGHAPASVGPRTAQRTGLAQGAPAGKAEDFVSIVPNKLPPAIERIINLAVREGRSPESTVLGLNRTAKKKFLTPDQVNRLTQVVRTRDVAYRTSPEGRFAMSGAVQNVDDPTQIANTMVEVGGGLGAVVGKQLGNEPLGKALGTTGAYIVPGTQTAFGVQAGANLMRGESGKALMDALGGRGGDIALRALGQFVAKPTYELFRQAIHGKNAILLEKAIQQAQREGVNPQAIASALNVPKATTAAKKPLPTTKAIPGGIRQTATSERPKKPPAKALPANASGAQYEVAPITKPGGKVVDAEAKPGTPAGSNSGRLGQEISPDVRAKKQANASDLSDEEFEALAKEHTTGTRWKELVETRNLAKQYPAARKKIDSFVKSGDIVYEGEKGSGGWRAVTPKGDAAIKEFKPINLAATETVVHRIGLLQSDIKNPKVKPVSGTKPPEAPQTKTSTGEKGVGTPEKEFEVRKLGQGSSGMTPEEIAAAQKKLGIQPPKETPPVVETPTPKPRFQPGIAKVDTGLPQKGPKVEIEPPVQPPKRVSSVGLGAKPQGQRVANASANAQRESMGLKSLEKTPRETTRQWFDEAQAKGYPNKALSTAVRILDDKSPFSKTRLSDAETAGMAARLDELDQQFQLTDTKNVGELERIVHEVDVITQATKKAGTEWGREGVARQTWFKSNYSESGLLRRFVAEGGGTKEATAAKVIGKDIAAGEKKVAQMKAEAGFYTTKGERIRGDIRTARSAALNRMKERYGKGGALGSKRAGAINLDIVDDLYNYTKDIGIIVKSVIQEGAVNLAQALPKIKSILAEAEISVSDETLERVLAGEYEKATRETAEAAKILQDLRKEAKSTKGVQRAQLERRIRETEARIKSGPNAPKPDSKFHSDLRDLEIKLMAKKVEADTIAGELRKQRLAKSRHIADKVYHEVADISRSVVASTDLSAPFNQGMFALGGHPIASAKAGWDMIKALKSESKVNELIAQTRLAKRYNEAVAAGLEVHGTRLGRGEEFFTSQILNSPWSIKGIDVNPIAASERAYTAYLNKLRMDMFENLVNAQEGKFLGLGRRTKLDIEQLKATAEYVNTVTGVGTGKVANAMKAANREIPALFAPGYMVSRWKTALGTPLINAAIRKNPKLAVAILKDYAAFAGMVGGSLYAAKLSGLDVDLTLENLGKIKLGNVEADPFGSILGPLRLLAKANKSPDQAPISAGFYMFGKMSPAARTVYDLKRGKNFDKKPVGFANWDDVWNLAKGNLPIMSQQQMELSNAEGLTEEQKSALRLLSIVGLNLNVKDQPAKGR